MAVAVDQHNRFKTLLVLLHPAPPPQPPRCREFEFEFEFGFELELDETNDSTLSSLNHKQAMELINVHHRSLSTPCLLSLSNNNNNNNTIEASNIVVNEGIEAIGGLDDPKARLLVNKVALALQSGADPIPAGSGLTGAYLLPSPVESNSDTSSSSIVAVIKPIEEPIAPDSGSPKGYSGQMLGQPGRRPSIRLGETGARELAAYLLDHDGFSGVPPTALVRISWEAFPSNIGTMKPYSRFRTASVQCYVEHESDAADLGPCCFSVGSIHRIGILDIRLLNLDRHAGNMLLLERSKEVIPIDHGLCLPERLDDPYFEWLHWPQALVPFSESEVAYVMGLDPMEDGETIRREVPSIRESSVRVLVLCTVFLKQAVMAGLTLAGIGAMMTRQYHRGHHHQDGGGGEESFSYSLLENLCMTTMGRMMLEEIDMSCCENMNELESFSVSEAATRESVSFGEVSEEKWLMFLEVFEKLLPHFFECRKKEGDCSRC